MRKFLLLAATCGLFFWGCSPAKQAAKQKAAAEKYYRVNPDELAQKCAAEYPVKDSVGQEVIDSIRQAHNEDFTDAIDSVNRAAADLIARIRAGSGGLADSIGRECADVIAGLNMQADSLGRYLKRLKAQYRPCVADTVYKTKTIFRENTARLAVCENEKGKVVSELRAAQDRLQAMTADRDEWKNTAKKRWWWIVALIAGIGVGVFLRIKGIF